MHDWSTLFSRELNELNAVCTDVFTFVSPFVELDFGDALEYVRSLEIFFPKARLETVPGHSVSYLYEVTSLSGNVSSRDRLLASIARIALKLIATNYRPTFTRGYAKESLTFARAQRTLRFRSLFVYIAIDQRR